MTFINSPVSANGAMTSGAPRLFIICHTSSEVVWSKHHRPVKSRGMGGGVLHRAGVSLVRVEAAPAAVAAITNNIFMVIVFG